MRLTFSWKTATVEAIRTPARDSTISIGEMGRFSNTREVPNTVKPKRSSR